MGAGADKVKLFIIYTIYEQPVWRDMTFSFSSMVSGKRVVFVFWWQWSGNEKRVYGSVQKGQIISPVFYTASNPFLYAVEAFRISMIKPLTGAYQ